MTPIAFGGSALAPGYYVAANGNDANPGTRSSPFLTFGKCATAMAGGAIKTTYLLDSGGVFSLASAWEMASDQTWLAYPGQAPIVEIAVSNSGAVSASNLTIGGDIMLIGSSNDQSGLLAIVNSSNVDVRDLSLFVSGQQQCINLYNLQTSKIRGNYLSAALNNSTDIISFGITDEPSTHTGVALISNEFVGGGRIALEWQCQGTTVILVDCNVDWNDFNGFGGTGAISWVGSISSSNTGNSCQHNSIRPASTTQSCSGIEFFVNGCTLQYNTMVDCPYAINVNDLPLSAILNNDITLSTTYLPGDYGAFTPAGSTYTGIGTWIGPNTITFSSTNVVNGCVPGSVGLCNLSPPPSATEPPLFPSADPYTPLSYAVPIPNGGEFVLAGDDWTAQNFGEPYSCQRNSIRTRYEVLNGQNCPSIPDPAWVMRSEVYGPRFPFNTNATFAFGLLVGAGPVVTNAWLICGQIHGDDTVPGGSPPFAFDIRPDGSGGEKLQFDLNYKVGSSAIVYTNIGSVPFKRNTLYDLQVVFRDAQGASSGYVQVAVNGVVEATYNGPTGYSTAVAESYPKWGIYTGGNGSTPNATPLPGQDIVAIYVNPTFVA